MIDGISDNYVYILTGNSRPGTKQNKTISATLVKLIAVQFGYDVNWILNGDSGNSSKSQIISRRH